MCVCVCVYLNCSWLVLATTGKERKASEWPKGIALQKNSPEEQN